MNRKETLDEAARCVMSDRNRDYGGPEDNFRTIAAIWNAYLAARGYTVDIEPVDVANLMIGVKLARAGTSPEKADHYVDLAGYAACAAEVVDKPQMALQDI